MTDDRKPDPQAEAERRLRTMLAAEARSERDTLAQIKKGFYGCITLVVVLFLALLFFF